MIFFSMFLWLMSHSFTGGSLIYSENCEFTPGTPITAISSPLSVPVLKGLAANPVVKVIISVPSGNTEQAVKKLQCTLNDYSGVEKVDVYVTGAGPFSSSSLIASTRPVTHAFDIPVALNIKPGLSFVWLSVVLKDNATLKNKIELRCTRLYTGNGNPVAVKQDSSGYAKYTGVAIRRANDDSVHTYRIPGAIKTDKGTLIAVYDIQYNNSSDLPGNIDVGMSRSSDGGRTWQPMKVIMDMGGPLDNSGIGDPCILFDETTKKIWVAALWSKGNRSIAGSIGGLSPDSTGQVILVSSADDGITWSAPVNITSQIKDPKWKILFQGPGNGISMRNGKLVFPAQYWDAGNKPYSTIIYSDDHGQSWKGNISGPKLNTTESQVVETTQGTLMLNMRDNRGSYRSVATTGDMGSTWTEHSTSYNVLQDPVCMGSLIKARVNVKGIMKEVLFFSNPATVSGRYNITIKASTDLGETWKGANQVLLDERPCYGYSSLVKVDDNTIGILYEGIKELYFVRVPVNDIIKYKGK